MVGACGRAGGQWQQERGSCRHLGTAWSQAPTSHHAQRQNHAPGTAAHPPGRPSSCRPPPAAPAAPRGPSAAGCRPPAHTGRVCTSAQCVVGGRGGYTSNRSCACCRCLTPRASNMRHETARHTWRTSCHRYCAASTPCSASTEGACRRGRGGRSVGGAQHLKEAPGENSGNRDCSRTMVRRSPQCTLPSPP